MIQNISQWFRSHEKVALIILTVFFIGIRLPGVDLPLHQDEYKWPKIVNPALEGSTEIPHPPLSQFIYREAGRMVGYDVDFRFVPLFFGTINLLLLYYFLRMRFGRQAAYVGGVLFTLSYFSILASLMVDTDGQIMPFFFLLALIAYYKAKVTSAREQVWWIVGLIAACILGFFVKVSFVLAIGAIVVDFLWEQRARLTKKEVVRYALIGCGMIGGLVILLFIAQTIFSFFDLSTAFSYWKHFIQSDRNWLQTAIQIVKAFLYTSPLLVFLPMFLSSEKKRELRPFILYICFGLVFYILLFDFSIGALDRYMQYVIIPLCALSAVALVSIWKSDGQKYTKEFLLLGSIIALVLLYLAGVHHAVPSLHPKSAWIGRALSLRWNFLYPFSGGSGPLGFYVSFLFLALSWIGICILVAVGYFKASFRKKMVLIMLPIAFVYNGLFTEEYLFGGLYGSASRLLPRAVEFIKNNPDIERVIVYNDNGGDEVYKTGKYERRMYTVPQFEQTYKEVLSAFEGHVLVIDIPRIDPESFYGQYLRSCDVIYTDLDKYITLSVFECSTSRN